jgi:hypothetical protein
LPLGEEVAGAIEEAGWEIKVTGVSIIRVPGTLEEIVATDAENPWV